MRPHIYVIYITSYTSQLAEANSYIFYRKEGSIAYDVGNIKRSVFKLCGIVCEVNINSYSYSVAIVTINSLVA